MLSAKVTSDANKYVYLVSLLDPDTLNLVADIVTVPHATEKFRVLKERLLELYGQAEETNARNLLKTRRIGDEEPSHFLQRLRDLARNNVPDAVLKNIFLEQVPRSMHDILVASETPDLNKLGNLADRLAEFQASQVASLEQHRMATPAPQSSMAARDDHVTTLVKVSNVWDLGHGWDSRRTRTSGCLTLLDARRRACIPPIVLQETIPGPSYGRSAT